MSENTERREPNRIVVEAAKQVRSKRGRRPRPDLHAPSPDQLALFDPENQS
ncbi:hypothetical protein IU448_22030 [Nocardia flavorosea]|uniref:hypothetical protein n=1 Tax=Nocardia flavorosea TaxID=53429 RepID=UPI00189309C6|nr:hypothetical protein [Nocardia flavorosea]MBF6351671.1 hypothetical protein [Nocardia flavorosea]